MVSVTGPMLRELREQAGVGVRAIARSTKGKDFTLSDGHLSRVERGERPVTEAIVLAYQRVLKVQINEDTIRQLMLKPKLGDMQRQAFNMTLGIVAAGGPPIGYDRLPEHPGASAVAPARVGGADVAHVEEAAGMARRLDLRFGGDRAGQLAEPMLRWALGLRTATMTDAVRARLNAAIGALAAWAAWSAFDAGHQEAARHLFTVAFSAAVEADEPDLRAHVLADVGAHYNYLGYQADCVRIVRLADGDERVSPAVRCLLHGVRARVYAAMGKRDHCIREVDLAEAATAAVDPQVVPHWLGGWEPAHVEAVCGHAVAVLAGTSGSEADAAEAHKRLTAAVDGLAPTGRRRVAALCLTRLATMHLAGGDHDEAASWMRQAEDAAIDLRSARVSRDLDVLRSQTTGGIGLV